MLGRILLITVIGMILSYIPSLFSHSGHDGFTGLLSSIIGFVFGWYELCYIYTLYKEAEADTPANYKPRMLWIYIVTIVGWVIAIVVAVIFVIIAMSPQFQNYMKHAPKTPPTHSAGYTLKK
jgi:heme/copper-type cytochrome/quinol oxidase subunit 2